MRNVNLIIAVSEDNVIGVGDRLPWHLGDDLKNFRKLTMGKTVIMGSNTFRSIGKPLPGRRNIVVSDSMTDAPDGIEVMSLDEAMVQDGELFVIGGARLFKSVIEKIGMFDHMYVTKVMCKVDDGSDGIVRLPDIDYSKYVVENIEPYEKGDVNDHRFMVVTYRLSEPRHKSYATYAKRRGVSRYIKADMEATDDMRPQVGDEIMRLGTGAKYVYMGISRIDGRAMFNTDDMDEVDSLTLVSDDGARKYELLNILKLYSK